MTEQITLKTFIVTKKLSFVATVEAENEKVAA